ncbi:MAG: branched-chain amino acid ABC transporter permease, partial [Oscillospiraceae bacterium]
LAIATLGFSEIIRIIITNAIPLTNGSLGLKNIPASANVWWTTGAAALAVVFMLRLMKTSYGRAFKALRDNDVAAETMGISLFKHKMVSFVIGGFMAGVSGGLIASVVGAINPSFFRFTLAYEILLIVVLGGQGSVTGSVVGACLLTISKEWLRFLDNGFSIGPLSFPAITGMRMLVFSALLMLVILFYRKGLFGSNEFSWDGLGRIITRFKSLFVKKAKGGDAE